MICHSDICYESTCQGKHDGYYPDTSQACRRYFQCKGGKVVSYENCRPGLLHDGRTCDYAEKVKCEPPKTLARRSYAANECSLLSDAFHADESSLDCKSYIKCFNGKLSKHRCQTATVFNPQEQNCVPEPLYDCPKSPRLEKLCKGKSDGLQIDPRGGCRNYVKCSRGIAVQFDECAKGQVFDANRRTCSASSSTQCHHETRSNECSNLEMGFYQDRSLESSCRNYFYCYNGRKTTLSCRTGQLFNGETCVDERVYTCPNLDADSCDTKENGYYKDDNLDCRSYFLCSSYRKYSFFCQNGQAFDGSKCVTKRHVELCSRQSDCASKPDGYYQDLKSGCMKYFYCKQGDKVQV